MPTLACIAILAALAVGAQAIQVDAATRSAKQNPVQVENAKPGTAGWLPTAASGRAIEGYASAVSAQPGERVSLHVSTSPAARYRIVVYRLGWYQGLGARRITCLPGCNTDEPGTIQPVPAPDPTTGKLDAGWPATDTLALPGDAVSGYFLVEFVLTSGAQAGRASFTYLIVRAPAAARPTNALVQVPVNTWQAYNDWGGKSLYDNLSTNGRRANRVSFERPYDWAPVPGGQPLEWEYPLVRWLERSGYDVSYQTDVDTDADPSSLLRHRLLITAGHGEYWTKTIRDAFGAARDSGGNLAFMGANTGYWQVRYEEDRQTVVAYKSRSDPEPDPSLKTTMFRDLEPPRYECELLGIQSQGVGLNWPPSDYVVGGAVSDPWMQGTGFRPGDVLPGIVSVESDTIPGNQTAADSCGHQLTVFFHHETGSDKSGNADAVRYTAASGARVFASGSHTFSWGLDDFPGNPDETHGLVQARLQRFARNAFDDLTRPAPPKAIDVHASGQGVLVSVDRLADPRLVRVVVSRRRVGIGRTVRVCSVARRTHVFCRDAVRTGSYRYFAVAVDRWRSSFPLQSQAVHVR